MAGGERVVLWTRFSNNDTGHCVNVFSTHFCVPIRNAGDRCDTDRQMEYTEKALRFIKDRQGPKAPSLFAGDFNVFEGFSDSLVVRYLEISGFQDVNLQYDSQDRGPTFQGNGWAPPGRTYYIFTESNAEILDSYFDRKAPTGRQGSDHFPIISTLQFRLPD